MKPEPGTLSRPSSISPPPKRRRRAEDDGRYISDAVVGVPSPSESRKAYQNDNKNEFEERFPANQQGAQPKAPLVASPVQLNFVEELSPASNLDTISLGNILGDVMIKECWLFNYLFDLDFVM